jgi:hypothetical protein
MIIILLNKVDAKDLEILKVLLKRYAAIIKTM